jgi:hypothetical protein
VQTVDTAASASPAGQAVDPTKARYVKSYAIRRAYSEAVQRPPDVAGVKDTIDIHCHAHEGQQDALALAQHASKQGMRGLLYKTIPGRDRPMQTLQRLQESLDRWCEAEEVAPIAAWAGYNVAPTNRPPSAAATREQLEAGVTAVWMPVAMHANTLHQVGGRPIWWGASKDPYEQVPPMPWEEALKLGHYLLDEHGRLKPEIREIIHLVADHGAALFFAHATHPEIFAMAEEVDRLGITRAVVDHPFSPFVDLSVEQMQQLARVGVYMNFTFDEISPLLGVDPYRMYQAIRAVGVEHVTLSSDAGEPLFPNSVECMRLMRAYMRAFGLTEEELHQVTTVNPAHVVGAD